MSPAFTEESTVPPDRTRFPFTKTPSMPVGGASLLSRVVLSLIVLQLKTVMSAAYPFLRYPRFSSLNRSADAPVIFLTASSMGTSL